jgi:molybdopterin-binding protein
MVFSMPVTATVIFLTALTKIQYRWYCPTILESSAPRRDNGGFSEDATETVTHVTAASRVDFLAKGKITSTFSKEPPMKVSARNLIPGKIKAITQGMVNTEVIIEVAPGVEITSIITKHSAEAMGLKEGDAVKAMVKASSVMLVTD